MYDSEWCLISSITSPAATSENPNFCSQIDQPTLRQMQQKSEKQENRAGEDEGSKKANKLEKEEAEVEEDEEVEREASLFEAGSSKSIV